MQNKKEIQKVITLLEKALDTLADVVITKTEYNSISNAIDLFENKINNKKERTHDQNKSKSRIQK